MTTPAGTELSVRSESIQRLYFLYLANRFDVNRRYQRKLVWSAAEKQRLVDSILQDLPIPLFLVAEIGLGAEASFEVIDGLQRLNAIFSFIENEIPTISGEFFDLDALADTKIRKDKGELIQKSPVMPRPRSVQFCNYSIAMSVFRAGRGSSVDEVFRRINSGGRRLSRQELRQAGTVSSLANMVRIISSQIRGDTSPGDNVPLRLMPQLSITNHQLDYGVNVDDIFWVRHGVLRREDVRTSLDEQVVLDILIDCLIEPTPSTGSNSRDEYYDFSNNIDEEATASTLSTQIGRAIDSYGPEKLQDDVLQSWSVLRDILDHQNARFATLIGVTRGGHAPRYFHVVYMAFFELMYKERMRVRDPQTIAERLNGIVNGPVKITGGSDWTGSAKRQSFDIVKGLLRPAFEQSGDRDDFGQHGWAVQFETLLSNALVEQQLFDCKQGILRLDDSRAVDSKAVEKICKTLSAMSNMGRKVTGHVVIGVADNNSTAQRITRLDSVSAIQYRRFFVTGIEREALSQGIDLNDYWTQTIQRIRDHKDLDQRLAKQIAANARLVHYSGLAIGILKVSSIGEPNFFGTELFERSGSETVRLDRPDYVRVYNRMLPTE